MADVLELVDRLVGADEKGRLSGAGPHLYVCRTTGAVLCRSHVDLTPNVAAALQRLALAPRGRPRDWPRELGQYLEVLAPVGPVTSIRAGLLYRVGDPPASPAVRITRSNAGLLRGGLEEWLPDVEAGGLIYAAIADGKAVSICASVKAVEGAHEAGVETLISHRGKGFAAAAVSAWAGAVQRLRATPFYGAAFDNLASQAVARRHRMDLVGSELTIACAPS